MMPRCTCPACGFVVFTQAPGSYELCPVCNWENDGVQYADPNYRGGANAESLIDAHAASVRRFPGEVRRLGELRRDPWWRLLVADEVAAGADAVPPWTDDGGAPYWMRSPLGWDTAGTVTDWYDGPIAGIANLDGRPHAYAATWDATEDDWNHNIFELRAVADGFVNLALEDWEIWLRWSAARMRGEDVAQSHPALPEDRSRHDELRTELASLRQLLPDPILAAPTWGWPTDPPGACGFLAVRWKVLA